MAYFHDGATGTSGTLLPLREDLCESPQQDAGSPSAHTDDLMTCSLDSLPEYDRLSRSSFCEERGLGPSGLDRIRQQQPRVLTLPNISNSSLALPDPSPRSCSPSRAYSMRVSSNPIPSALDDLYRFPSESLHSFSFAQQSGEQFHSRQSILKRSIDFMRDHFGLASEHLETTNVRTHVCIDDSNAKIRGPITGPAYMDYGNVFERSFSEHKPSIPESREASHENSLAHDSIYECSNSFHPLPKEDISHSKREMKSSPSSRRVSLKRTYAEANLATLEDTLMRTLAQVPSTVYPLSPIDSWGLSFPSPALHTHSSKWNPVYQAVFRTEAQAPWTILAANDLACLVFGVAQSEVRKLSILEVAQEEYRQWLESKLSDPSTDSTAKHRHPSDKRRAAPISSGLVGLGNGVTAQLLSKPPSRAAAPRIPKRSKTDDGYNTQSNAPTNHAARKSRGVLLCGEVLPIQKRNGIRGSASVWVIEKRGGLIWVLEEITEDVAYVRCDSNWDIVEAHGAADKIWGQGVVVPGEPITEFLPHIPQGRLEDSSASGLNGTNERKHFAALTAAGTSVPVTITISRADDGHSLRVSSFPHVAGMMVLSSSTLQVVSSNSVFSSVLFGQERPEGMHITELIPGFTDLLFVLTEEDKIPLVDGILIPEQSFRRARTLVILREGKSSVASVFAEPVGLAANHRDGSTIAVDIQMRVMKSGMIFQANQETASAGRNDSGDEVMELVYALWITHSRHIHSTVPATTGWPVPFSEAVADPCYLPLQTAMTTVSHETTTFQPCVQTKYQSPSLDKQLSEAASEPLTDRPVQPVPPVKLANAKSEPPKKRTISDYVILEEMGQGAYGEVKLARLKKNPAKKMVLKYVTKKKILMDTWTRDRRLGTVPLEIHVLDYLRRDELRHPNIVEMEGFFEDDLNYYIEMMPHGLPGMDLFDYIELKANMDEVECKSIFSQVVDAIHHLHTKALVVHRDIKDENVILDGEGMIKLIDFGSAAYIKNGPFDVFVGTIDYAAPEVLQGKSYRGKEQDIWALGILLYTIVYKENPFYNVDEILDHPLRVPFLPFSEDCIDLIRKMLDRDVDNRLTITEVMEHPWMTDS